MLGSVIVVSGNGATVMVGIDTGGSVIAGVEMDGTVIDGTHDLRRRLTARL